ncbi:magnesium/cobalt transporter CorA [Flavobacterium solisilvae]|uniref:Magnesium transport protein CorA n=1 Tax=Flavobacterium solisilvae TaxID=1852019 RepID=A0ABX1QRG5_9FLAO|nr:magnesium/cobalt transporter CorA [Flavobacterium solisilvae]NMH24283.1 magnesium/cobalt transporter CorA [Flavobacterium solisilvae]
MRKIKYKKGRKVKPTILEYTGIHKQVKSEMQLFVYDTDDLTEFAEFDVSQIHNCIDETKVNWLNIHGLNDIELIKSIGHFLKVDHFMLGDILNTTKRTKLDEYHDVLFFNIKSLLPIENTDNISVEQISFLLKDGILVSFQEKRSDFFTHIRERIRTHSGIVRDKKADYLLYLLLDAVIENFYFTIENEEDRVEELINLSKSSTKPQVLEQIEQHRDNFNFLKRSIIPLRDSLYSIKSIKDDNVFNAIEHENYSFFSRLHQKCLELLEQIEYDLISLDSASNFYFSSQNQKLNEVMKTLTVVSVFFMPLTFIVGVYGMNFDNMPELHWKYGYFYILGFMFLLLLGMIFYFKKRKWY